MKSSRFLLSLVILLLAVALPSRAADAPVITAVSPRQVPAGSPGFTLVVQGRSFDKSSVVLCNGLERNTTWISDHMLRAAILTSDVAKRGAIHIGGQNDNGTILTLYGKRFGPTQGGSTITVGGGQVASYLLWSDSKVAVAIGANAATGSVVVHTSAGGSNNGPFTVRPRHIYFVLPAGAATHP